MKKKGVARRIQRIERLYVVFDKFVDQSKLDSKDEKNIKSVIRIVRTELKSPSMLQNADLSLKTA